MKDKLVILVTGSSGFSGQVLIPKLRTLGYEVIGIDYKSGPYTTEVIDISKPFTIKQSVETVIHLLCIIVRISRMRNVHVCHD